MSSLLLVLALLAGAPAPRVLDRVAATVNGDVVTLRELQERAGSEYQRADGMPAGPDRDKARARVLKLAFDQIVDERLFEAQASTMQVDVNEAQIDSAVEDVKRRNHFSDAQLDQALAEQGMTRDAFRKALKKELETYQILQYKVRSRVKVTDEDVKNYYQQHGKEFAGDDAIRVRLIFFAVPKGAPASEEARIRAKAEQVLARIKGGADFAATAREVSEGPSRAEGGDLGFLKRGVMLPELERVAFSMQAGQVSGLVRTDPGIGILKLEERRVAGARPFEEVKEEIRDRLTNEQIGTFRNQYVAELRKDAIIDAKIPELR
jgi:peptidyl-prolyl cis-trans isomerase SurA